MVTFAHLARRSLYGVFAITFQFKGPASRNTCSTLLPRPTMHFFCLMIPGRSRVIKNLTKSARLSSLGC